MKRISTVLPTIRSIAAKLPEHSWTTDELLNAAGDRLSDKLRDMLTRLGVEKRHSVLANYPSVLFEGIPRRNIPISGVRLLSRQLGCVSRKRTSIQMR